MSYSFCVYVFVLFGCGVLGLGFLSSLPLRLITIHTYHVHVQKCTHIKMYMYIHPSPPNIEPLRWKLYGFRHSLLESKTEIECHVAGKTPNQVYYNNIINMKNCHGGARQASAPCTHSAADTHQQIESRQIFSTRSFAPHAEITTDRQ